MPSCPDCGVVFDSMYSVQSHRRSGQCRAPHSVSSQVPIATHSPAGQGFGLPPINDAYYRQVAHGDPTGPGVIPMSGADRDLENFLAMQRAQQADDLARRERQLLDQQVNLVLPSRQAQLQQTQDQLKNQLMQLKLNLLTQQQAQQQGSNMDLEYLKNEMNAVRNTVSSLQMGGPNPEYGMAGGFPLAANSWPQQGNARAARAGANQRAQPSQNRSARGTSPGARRRGARDRNSGGNNNNNNNRHRARAAGGRRGRYGNNDDDWSDDSYSSYDDYSDEYDSYSEDDDGYDSDGYDDEADHRHGRRSKPHGRKTNARASSSRSPGAASGRGSSRAPTRPRDDRKPTANSGRSRSAAAHPAAPDSGVPRTASGRSATKNSDVFGESPSLADQLKGMMQAMREEIQSLKGNNSVAPPFPTASVLQAGPHTLQLSTLEGLDLSIPLDDLEVSLKTYYMFNNSGEFVLEPAAEKVFPKNPPPLMRASTRLLLFNVPPMEFTVNKPHDMNVFVLQVKYRGRLLYWATIFAKASGTWTEGVRASLFDLAAALQSTEDMIPGATVTGTIQQIEPADVLADAERFLRRASTVSNNGAASPIDPRRSTAASLAKDAADAVAAVAARNGSTTTPSLSEPQEPPKPMPGLPDLDPVPNGLPVLPGMPGNEGPFLPPTATAHMTKQKGPFKHFSLPPPPGTSILEWRDRFTKQTEKRTANAHFAGDVTDAGKRSNRNSPSSANNNNNSNNNNGNSRRGGNKPASGPPRRGDKGTTSPGSTSPSVMSPSMPPKPGVTVGGVDFGSHVNSDESGSSSDISSLAESTRKSPTKKATSPQKKVDAKEHTRDDEKKVKIMAETPKRNDQKDNNNNNGASSDARQPKPAAPPAPTEPQPAPEGLLNTSQRQPKPPATAKPGSPNNSVSAPPPPPVMPGNESINAPPQPPQAAAPPPDPNASSRRPSVNPQRALLPIADKAGNLAVPSGYKSAAAPPIAAMEQHDQKTAANACVVIGLAQPTDKPPQNLRHCGHGAKGNELDLFVDGVVGVPLNAICTRLVIYITDEVDPNTGNIVNPLRNPRVFMRKPDLVVYQALDSSNIEPEFTGKLSTVVGEGTHAVVVVEYVTGSEDYPPIALGHCCLPINKRFFAGNFLSRLKFGDPRRSQERMVDDVRPADRIADEQRRLTDKYTQMQLEASVDAQALRNLMPLPPRSRAECVPMGYLIWRADSPNQNLPYFEMPGQLPPSKQEIDIFNSRVGVGDKPPLAAGLKTPKDAQNRFVGGAVPLSDNIGYLAPYSPQRGCFLRVDGVRGVGPGDAFHVVVGRVLMGPTGRNTFWTRFPNWESDVGAPTWVDPPFMVSGLAFNPLSCAVFTLLRVTPSAGGAEAAYQCAPIGWTIAKLFLDAPNIMRQGNFVLPWLAGAPPEAFTRQLAKEKMDKLFLGGLNNKTISFLEPPATLRLSQGDAGVVPQLVEDTPGRPAARTLLMPAQLKGNFPIATNQGVTGRSLRQLHEASFGGGVPKSTLEKIDGAVINYLKASAREL